MSVTPFEDNRVAQLIDANLDRAREGIRVVEDWCRVAYGDTSIVVKLKNCRQKLGKHHHLTYKKARNTSKDNGIGIDHPAQLERYSPQDIVAANFARVQEALRVLEEFSRILDPQLSKTANSIRYEIYDLEVKLMQEVSMHERLEKLDKTNLCLITSSNIDLKEKVRLSLQAGAKMIQFRSKEKNDMIMFNQAKELGEICKSFNALFIVNDRVDLAYAVDADGVHLGQDDLSPIVARNILGKNKIIGKSIHFIEEIKIAEYQGCDYLGVGPIFISESKPKLNPKGLAFLKQCLSLSSLPVFAIGGIDKSNLSSVLGVGARRIAVISAIMNQGDPFQSTANLLNCLS